MANIVKQALL